MPIFTHGSGSGQSFWNADHLLHIQQHPSAANKCFLHFPHGVARVNHKARDIKDKLLAAGPKSVIEITLAEFRPCDGRVESQ